MNTIKPVRSWIWIVGVSVVVSLVAFASGFIVLFSALGILGALFSFGLVGGALASRQGWFPGLIVGWPFSWLLFTRHFFNGATLLTEGVDYWRVVPITAFLTTGVAVLGGISGAWLFGVRFSK